MIRVGQGLVVDDVSMHTYRLVGPGQVRIEATTQADVDATSPVTTLHIIALAAFHWQEVLEGEINWFTVPEAMITAPRAD